MDTRHTYTVVFKWYFQGSGQWLCFTGTRWNIHIGACRQLLHSSRLLWPRWFSYITFINFLPIWKSVTMGTLLHSRRRESCARQESFVGKASLVHQRIRYMLGLGYFWTLYTLNGARLVFVVLSWCQCHGCRRPSASMRRRPGACIGSLFGLMPWFCYILYLWRPYGGEMWLELEWVLLPFLREWDVENERVF